MQVPESGTLVHGTPEASVRGKLGLSSLGRVYMGLKLVGLQAPRMMGVISTESCSTECFDLEGNLNQQAVGLLLDESTSPLRLLRNKNESRTLVRLPCGVDIWSNPRSFGTDPAQEKSPKAQCQRHIAEESPRKKASYHSTGKMPWYSTEIFIYSSIFVTNS